MCSEGRSYIVFLSQTLIIIVVIVVKKYIWEVIDMFMALIVVRVSEMYKYSKLNWLYRLSMSSLPYVNHTSIEWFTFFF